MTPAIRVLERAGVAFELLSYRHDPNCREFGLEAAERLGLDPAVVFKTLLVRVHNVRPEATLALLPVDRRLDLKLVAAARQGKKAEMMDPQSAEKLTGYVVGGISPLGQKKRLPTLIDHSATGHARIYVSGGRRGLDIALDPAALQGLLDATAAAISIAR